MNGSSSSQQVCRFGYDCRRPDCWFSHPEGRQIDGNSAPPPSLASLPAHAIAGAGAANFHLTQNHVSSAPISSNLPSSSSSSSSSSSWASGGHEKKQPVVCRYGRACHRLDCWFSHPEGRSIDDSSSSSSSSQLNGIHQSSNDSKELDEEEAVLNQLEAEKGLSVYDVADECECCGGSPYDCTNPECAAQGICDCLMEAVEDHISTPSTASISSLPPWIRGQNSEGDDSWKDEWFPQCRNCECCEGYIYRCKKTRNAQCETQCFCFSLALVSSNVHGAEESKASLPATVDEQK